MAVLTSGTMSSRAADLMGRSSSAFVRTTTFDSVSPLQLALLWDEFAEIVRFAEKMVPILNSSKAHKTFNSGKDATYFTVLSLQTGSMDLGPIKSASHKFTVHNMTGTTSVDTNGMLRNGGGPYSFNITDRDGVAVATLDGEAGTIAYAFCHAAHNMLDNTISVFQYMYGQMQRSNTELPDDVITNTRAKSLFGGPIQKVLNGWPASPFMYQTTSMTATDLSAGKAMSTALQPALLASIAPLTYDALLNQTHMFVE